VKLYSLNYLLLALFLLAPGLPRLINSLVLGKAVEAMALSPLFGSIKLDRVGQVLRTLVVIGLVLSQVEGSRKRWSEMYGGPPAPVLGRWDLVSIAVDKNKPADDDPMNWSWLDFSNSKIMRLSGRKPPVTAYLITWNTESKKLTLNKVRPPQMSVTFDYDLPEPEMLTLQGSMDGKWITANLKRAAEKRYELMTRGFNWIQELPYNR
jgi:hypothetical protein